MKRMILSLMLFWVTLSSMAQTLHVQTGTVEYAFSAAQTGNMLFDNGSTLTIQGCTFAIDEIDQIYVVIMVSWGFADPERPGQYRGDYLR